MRAHIRPSRFLGGRPICKKNPPNQRTTTFSLGKDSRKHYHYLITSAQQLCDDSFQALKQVAKLPFQSLEMTGEVDKIFLLSACIDSPK